MQTLKALHDAHLADMPEGAVHDSASCPLCAIDETENGGRPDAGREGRMSDAKTYTEEELAAAVDAAVTEAVGPLKEQVEKFQQAQASSETAEQIAAAEAPLKADIANLQKKLDEATVSAESAKKRADDIEAFLAAEEQARKEAEELAARKEERVKAAREVVAFSDEYVEANAERWAAMSDEAWTAALDGWREVAVAGNGSGIKPPTSEIPRETALHASRDSGGKSKSAARDVVRLRRSGINVHTLTR